MTIAEEHRGRDVGWTHELLKAAGGGDGYAVVVPGGPRQVQIAASRRFRVIVSSSDMKFVSRDIPGTRGIIRYGMRASSAPENSSVNSRGCMQLNMFKLHDARHPFGVTSRTRDSSLLSLFSGGSCVCLFFSEQICSLIGRLDAKENNL